MNSETTVRQERKRKLGVVSLMPFIVLAAAVTGTLFAWRLSVSNAEQKNHQRFQQAVDRVSTIIPARIKEYNNISQSGVGLFAASKSVERIEWQKFTDKLDFRQNYPGITGLGYIAYVPESKLDTFLGETRADNTPNFEIKPAGKRAEYFVLKYLEPEKEFESVIGVDRGLRLHERAGLEAARDSGEVHVVVMPDSQRDGALASFDYLQFFPVYVNGMPHNTIDERRQAIAGWILATIDTKALIQSCLANSDVAEGIDLEVYDGHDVVADSLIYDMNGVRLDAEGQQGAYVTSQKVGFGTRTWTLQISGDEAFAAGTDETTATLVLILGLIASLLLSGITATLVGTRFRAERLAHEMSREARDSEQRTKLVIDNALDALITIDEKYEITDWNPQAEAMFGWKRSEVLGRDMPTLALSPAFIDDFRDGIRRFLESGGVDQDLNRRVEVSGRRRDGVEFPAEIAAAPCRIEDEWMFAVFVRDISDRKAAEVEIQKSREAAESANRAKSDFLANMSHEIRTPMNGVLGMTGLLLDTDLDEYQTDLADTVRNSAEALLNIINDILDFSKIEAGKLTLELIPMDLRQVVEEVGDLLGTRASSKGIDLIIRYAPDAPRFFVGDPGRIRQVLINFAGNAIKFTNKGYVSVDVDLIPGSENGRARMRLVVSDSGVGIPESKLPGLFTKFTQVDNSTTREFGGTGLGLAISKQLAELMGGKVGVSSQVGLGSKFWAEIEVERDKNADSAPLTRSELRGLRLLVVDDIEVNLKLIAEILTRCGMVCTTTTSPLEAIRLADAALERGEPYQFVLTDYQMPDMDGVELVQKLREDPRHHQMVTLLISSADAIRREELVNQSGVDGVILKPLRQARLLDTLCKLAPTRRGDTPAPAVTKPRTGPVMDAALEQPPEQGNGRKRLRVLVVEDNPVNQKVAVMMLQRQDCRVDVAANGQEAVEILKQVPFDLILMDCQMPIMDGFEATRVIRMMEGTPRTTPIIALTANAMQGDRERCLAAGMDDYLAKPINPNDMEEVLERWRGATSDSWSED